MNTRAKKESSFNKPFLKKRFIAAILIGIALISVMVTPAMAADFWQSDSDITSSLGVDWQDSSPTVFNKDGTWYLIAGDSGGVFYGFKWNGSVWQSDPAIVSGLEDYGYPNGIERDSEPEVFYKDGTWYLISSVLYHEYPYPHGFIGFYWNPKRSKWLPDSDIVAGLPERVEINLREPTVFNKDGTWYLISGEGDRDIHGYNWTGSAWQSDSAIVSGLGVIRTPAPTVFNKDGTWYLISGEYFGRFYGYKWTGSAWESNPAIVSGLGSIGYYSRPDVFNMDETWYLISGEYYGTFYGWHQVKTPDLTTTAINAPQLIVNQPSSITATIANVGDADASAFNVSLSANGVVVDAVNIPSLGVGNSTGVSFEWTPTSVADQELCVVADSNDAIDEVYEANNKECITVTVNAPDLTPTAINVPALFENLASTVTATIDNAGTLNASAFNVSLSADGTVVDTVSVLSLGAGGSTDVSFKWTPVSAGDHKLCVTADYDGTITELDETNNETCIEVTVGSPSIDVGKTVWDTVSGTWEKEVTAESGDTLRFRCSVNNGAYNLTNVTVVDILSDSLEYSSGSATVDGTPNEPVEVGPNEYEWNFTGLAQGQNMTIEFDARVALISEGTNVQRVTAWCEETCEWVSDVDSVNVIVPCGIPTPFLIYGFVYLGEPVSNPQVIVTNLNASEPYIVNTTEDSHYYQVSTCSEKVSAGDVLHFRASNGAVIKEFNHTVTEEEITSGVLVQDISLSGMPAPEITNPADKSCISGTVTIEAVDKSCEEDIAYTQFEYYRDTNCNRFADDGNNWTEIARDSEGSDGWTADWNTTGMDDGCYLLRATMEDVHGLSGSDKVSVHVNNLPDLTVSAINAYHNDVKCPPWFNLSNEVEVTVKNVGKCAYAGTSNVSLYIDGELFGELPVPGMNASESKTVQFDKKWEPKGEDCFDNCNYSWADRDYNFTGVADCDNDVAESNETNNETIVVETACYNGYMGDEPLENVKHGELRGGLIYTTGNGKYISGSGTHPGDSWTFDNYTITIPDGASVALARVNVYYTWSYISYTEPGPCPYIEVSITNHETGETHVASLEKTYNDCKCTCSNARYVFPFGTYAYNVTDYISGSGRYEVTVTNAGEHPDHQFSFAAPAIVLVYEDERSPEIEYWINEGADVMLSGHTLTPSDLSLEECINRATFPVMGSINVSNVTNAALGVVASWGETGAEDVLYFNGSELGRSIYHGHDSPYSKTIDGITMHVGASNSQVGVNVTNVTGYLNASGNIAAVGIGGDGDTMMATNAFLVVEYAGPPAIPAILANVTFDQKKINLWSGGILKAFITLPEGYNVTDINVSTVECEGAPALVGGGVIPGRKAFEAKFKIPDLTGVEPGPEVELTVTGKLFNGTVFEGSDTLEVIAEEPAPTPTPTPTPAPTPTPPIWTSDSAIVTGLENVGKHSAPTVFDTDGTWYLITGEYDGEFVGYNWTGAAWQSDTAIVSGLGDIGDASAPTVFDKDETRYLIAGNYTGAFNGYNWTGTAWQLDTAIVSGLEYAGDCSDPTVFCIDGTTWYLISGEKYGTFHGYKWSEASSAWENDTAIVSGLVKLAGWSAPTAFYRNGTWNLIAGEYYGEFYGYTWNGTAWQSDDAIVSGLGSVGFDSRPAVFDNSGTWYLIAGERDGGFNGYKAS